VEELLEDEEGHEPRRGRAEDRQYRRAPRERTGQHVKESAADQGTRRERDQGQQEPLERLRPPQQRQTARKRYGAHRDTAGRDPCERRHRVRIPTWRIS
jgi:hypothetical protein